MPKLTARMLGIVRGGTMAIIYKITSPSGRVYIGSTKVKLNKRWNGHKYDYRHWKECGRKYCSSFILFDESGNPDDCMHVVVEVVEDPSLLKVRERHWIESQECVNKYRPYVTTEEIIERMRRNARARYDAKRDELLVQQAERITCECGSVHRRGNTTNHRRSEKHQAYLTSLAIPTEP